MTASALVLVSCGSSGSTSEPLVDACIAGADEAIIDAATFDAIEGRPNMPIPPGAKTGRDAVQAHSQECAITPNDQGGCFDETIAVQSGGADAEADHTACMSDCIRGRVGAVSNDCLTCFGAAATCAAINCSASGDSSCICLLGDQCCDDSTETESGFDCTDGSACNTCIIDNCLAALTTCTGAEVVEFFTCDEPNDYCPGS